MNHSEHVAALVSDLLDDIALSRLDAERLLLKCSRLARLTATTRFRWIACEMRGYVSNEAMALRYMSLTGRWTDYEEGWWSPRTRVV
ncbi:hypothetical protein [Sphingomonas sp.]|uniref:AbiTii domain-containing protein n=1 Tax=Sphingomonas sp. TaxID=28214 RepID=UPI003B002901